MPPRDDETWARARGLYGKGVVLAAIEAELGIPRTTISTRAQREAWPRGPVVSRGRRFSRALDRRADILAKMVRTFERQIAELEARFSDGAAGFDEKDARMLGVLAKTFETLSALEREEEARHARTEASGDGPDDIDQRRAQLAAELAKLAAADGP